MRERPQDVKELDEQISKISKEIVEQQTKHDNALSQRKAIYVNPENHKTGVIIDSLGINDLKQSAYALWQNQNSIVKSASSKKQDLERERKNIENQRDNALAEYKANLKTQIQKADSNITQTDILLKEKINKQNEDITRKNSEDSVLISNNFYHQIVVLSQMRHPQYTKDDTDIIRENKKRNANTNKIIGLFIFLLFLVMETAPVLMKWIIPRGPYDELLDFAENKLETDIQAEMQIHTQKKIKHGPRQKTNQTNRLWIK